MFISNLIIDFLKWKINDKERRNRDEGHFFRRNYMYIIWFFKNCFHWHIYWRNLIQHWYSVTNINSCWHYKNKFQNLYTFSLTWKAMIEQFKDSTNGPIEIIVVAIHYKHLKIGQIYWFYWYITSLLDFTNLIFFSVASTFFIVKWNLLSLIVNIKRTNLLNKNTFFKR